ncbi:MAG: hypothetical protein EXS36_00850 [Pedosphaera sp.]|nr:hypothetical protein [Pedosphaera sp.]
MKKSRDSSQKIPAWLEGVWSGAVPPTARELIANPSLRNRLPENNQPSQSPPHREIIDPLQLEDELALNRALRAASAPPASSNFTRRVMDAARAESANRRSNRPIGWLDGLGDEIQARLRTLFRVLRATRAVGAASVGLLALLAWFQWQGQQRTRLAHSVAAMARSTQATESTRLPAYLRDFDAIQVVGAAPHLDDVALLTALSQ